MRSHFSTYQWYPSPSSTRIATRWPLSPEDLVCGTSEDEHAAGISLASGPSEPQSRDQQMMILRRWSERSDTTEDQDQDLVPTHWGTSRTEDETTVEAFCGHGNIACLLHGSAVVPMDFLASASRYGVYWRTPADDGDGATSLDRSDPAEGERPPTVLARSTCMSQRSKTTEGLRGPIRIHSHAARRSQRSA
jgi:hypothetical protein